MRNGLTCSLCLFTHSLVHLTFLCREPYGVQGLHWALGPVLEELQQVERQMKRSLGRQRWPLSLPGVSRKAPWRRLFFGGVWTSKWKVLGAGRAAADVTAWCVCKCLCLSELSLGGHQSQVPMGLKCQAAKLASAWWMPAEEPWMVCKKGRGVIQFEM